MKIFEISGFLHVKKKKSARELEKVHVKIWFCPWKFLPKDTRENQIRAREKNQKRHPWKPKSGREKKWSIKSEFSLCRHFYRYHYWNFTSSGYLTIMHVGDPPETPEAGVLGLCMCGRLIPKECLINNSIASSAELVRLTCFSDSVSIIKFSVKFLVKS